jgi:hypothetical protein
MPFQDSTDGFQTPVLPPSLLNLEEIDSYKIIYSGFLAAAKTPRILLKPLVGAAGLEPATLCLEGRCSIRLSYAPTS